MTGPSSNRKLIVVEWSPGHVRIFDPATRRVVAGVSLAECLPLEWRGREAVFAIAARSAFVRGLFVPKVSRPEAERIIDFQLASMIPLSPREYVFGFRLGADAGEKGRVAVVGAVKAESLRNIHREAEEAGLRVVQVLPLAFGSWLAARDRGLANCLVVEGEGDSVSIDVIHNGELFYSRSIPRPESPSELRSEVLRTSAIAELPPSPVLTTGCPGIHPDHTYDREALQYLGDPAENRRLIFSLELPEILEAKRAKADRWKAPRALAAAALVIVLASYAVYDRIPKTDPPLRLSTSVRSAIQASRSHLSRAKTQLAEAEKSNRILDVAFRPGQSISDVVVALSHLANQNVWFTALTLQRGAPTSISGLALSDSDVAKFSAAVSKDPRFEDMKVVTSHKAAIGNRPVTQFLAVGRMRGLLPFDRPPKGAKKP